MKTLDGSFRDGLSQLSVSSTLALSHPEQTHRWIPPGSVTFFGPPTQIDLRPFDDFISSEKQLRGEYHAKRVSGL